MTDPVATQSHPDVHGTTDGCPVDNRLISQRCPDSFGVESGCLMDIRMSHGQPDTFGTAPDVHWIAKWFWAVPKPSGWRWDSKFSVSDVSVLLRDGNLQSQCHPNDLGIGNSLSL